jgi:glycosyltransferase involved in cell wall biosynthesis
VSWGVEPERVVVVPNPAPELPPLESREELRRRFGGRVLAFAGRLVPAKALDVAIDALAEADGVTLLVAGDGPERDVLERRSERVGVDERVIFLGPRPREQVLALFRLADAALLSSRWENSPHAAIEALAVSAPVIATNVGGVAETVVDSENGLLVPPDDPHALAGEIRRFFADGELRNRLRRAAAASVTRLSPDNVHGRIEDLLRENARDAGRRGHGHLAAGRGRSGDARP